MKSSRIDERWIEEELASADFGDLRLNKRFQILASELANHPSKSINQASTDWAATKAAYRFFDNPKVQAAQILEPHFLSTQLRVQGHQRLVVVQDTSFIDFTNHIKTEGLGPTARKPTYENLGLLLHCGLALSEKGLPLGLLAHKVWPRTHKREKDSYLRSLTPVEQKESFKWFEAFRSTFERTFDQEVIMVCDREADIYEFLEEMMTVGTDFVIRAKSPRMLEDEEFGDINLFDRIAVAPVKSNVTITVSGNGKRRERTATLSLKFLPVTLAAHPRGIKTKQVAGRSQLELHVVHLYEAHPPRGEAAIHWTLITSLPSKSVADALEVVRFYQMRWQVELYFKSLKTGCGVEKCRLASADKLVRYIALQSIIAWRILWMTFLNRVEPKLSCEEFLTEDEWKTLWLKKHRRQIKSGTIKPVPPEKPPSTREAIRWIAMQGGFLGRKGDGEPGQITLWRGWLELMAAVEIYEVMK